MRAGTSPGITAQPKGPNLTTNTARLSARTRAKAGISSASPPAIRNSSTVPTMRSNSESRLCKWALTSALAM